MLCCWPNSFAPFLDDRGTRYRVTLPDIQCLHGIPWLACARCRFKPCSIPPFNYPWSSGPRIEVLVISESLKHPFLHSNLKEMKLSLEPAAAACTSRSISSQMLRHWVGGAASYVACALPRNVDVKPTAAWHNTADSDPEPEYLPQRATLTLHDLLWQV